MNAEVHYKYWTDPDMEKLAKATTFLELACIALAVIARMPRDLHMVSGPISTGGVGTVEGNCKVFKGMIELLALHCHLNMFSQMPFEKRMAELSIKWHAENPTETYCTPILDDFYTPVFRSGRICAVHFLDGWGSSFGAKWEHDNCELWNIQRIFLTKESSDLALWFGSEGELVTEEVPE